MGVFGTAPEFLPDGEIYVRLRKLITNSCERLVIVSPYIDPSDDFVREIETASLVRKVDVRLIFRREKLAEYQQTSWLQRLRKARVALATVERLHSKLYLNEQDAIITSMNFSKSSGENSFEVGIICEIGHKLGRAAESYLEGLARHLAEVPEVADEPRLFRGAASNSRASIPGPNRAGVCIRCGTGIPLNPKRPYCLTDYEKWSEYQNVGYEEKHCHGCGKRHPTTMNRPLCRDCYATTS